VPDGEEAQSNNRRRQEGIKPPRRVVITPARSSETLARPTAKLPKIFGLLTGFPGFFLPRFAI
jgi:hypothetical protein